MRIAVFDDADFIGAFVARLLAEAKVDGGGEFGGWDFYVEERYAHVHYLAFWPPQITFGQVYHGMQISLDLEEYNVGANTKLSTGHRESMHPIGGCFGTNFIHPNNRLGTIRDEQTKWMPTTSQGASKLAAKINPMVCQREGVTWFFFNIPTGSIVTLRKSGSVPRKIKHVRKALHFWLGNTQAQKALVYIKELRSLFERVVESMSNPSDSKSHIDAVFSKNLKKAFPSLEILYGC